jgi:very-short-patch-repair endonuclease
MHPTSLLYAMFISNLVLFAGILFFAFRWVTAQRAANHVRHILTLTLQKSTFYRKKDALLTSSERTFFYFLIKSFGARYQVCPQIHLTDLVRIEAGDSYSAEMVRYMGMKSVDFVLFDRATFAPLVAVELDGKEHETLFDRRNRDAEKELILEQAGIPLVRIPRAYAYGEDGIRKIMSLLSTL